MYETTSVDIAIAATVETEPGHTPRVYLCRKGATPAPYIRLDTIEIEDPDSWPRYDRRAKLINIEEGALPKYKGRATLVIPCAAEADRVAVAVEVGDPDLMEDLARLLLRTAELVRTGMHDPQAVREAYGHGGEPADLYERSLNNSASTP